MELAAGSSGDASAGPWSEDVGLSLALGMGTAWGPLALDASLPPRLRQVTPPDSTRTPAP